MTSLLRILGVALVLGGCSTDGRGLRLGGDAGAGDAAGVEAQVFAMAESLPDAGVAAPDVVPGADVVEEVPSMGAGDAAGAPDAVQVGRDAVVATADARQGQDAGAASADTAPPVPETCSELQVHLVTVPCGGNWPGTTIPCYSGCQAGSASKLPGANTLWSCFTWTSDISTNGGQIVCVGGGLAGCNTYCPASKPVK